METSLSMKTIAQNGTKNTTTLSYVNPNASDELLKTYAQKLASLTTDTYNSTTKIQKTDLDSEAEDKLSRTITCTHNSTTITSNPAVISYGDITGTDSSEYDDMVVVEWTGNTVPATAVTYRFSWDPEDGEYTPPDITFNGDANPTGERGKGTSFNLGQSDTSFTTGKSFTIHMMIPGDSVYRDTEYAVSIVGGGS